MLPCFIAETLVHEGSESATASRETVGKCCDLGKGMTTPGRLALLEILRAAKFQSGPDICGAERLGMKDIGAAKVNPPSSGNYTERNPPALLYYMTNAHRCRCTGEQCRGIPKHLLYNDGKLSCHSSTATTGSQRPSRSGLRKLWRLRSFERSYNDLNPALIHRSSQTQQHLRPPQK